MSTDPKPLISIIVAVYNGARTLQQCIDSVVHQTYLNRELIIIDGGSRDGTAEILTENSDKINYSLSEPDQGIYDAWNKALVRARGEWICFLGADDYLWDADVLEKLIPHLAPAQKATRIVYCQSVMVDIEGNELARLGRPWPEIKRQFPYVMGIPHPATFYHRTVFASHGKFDTSFRIAGDFEFLLRELRSADALFVPGIVTTGMQHGGISSAGRNSLSVLKEMRIAQRKHGYAIPGAKWVMAYIRVRLRLCLWTCIGKNRSAGLLDWGRRITGRGPFWTRI